MFRTIFTDGTFAYMGFLVLMLAHHVVSPAKRRSRSLRRRVGAYSMKDRA